MLKQKRISFLAQTCRVKNNIFSYMKAKFITKKTSHIATKKHPKMKGVFVIKNESMFEYLRLRGQVYDRYAQLSLQQTLA